VSVSLGTRESVQPITDGSDRLLVQKAQLPNLTKSVSLRDSVTAPVAKGDSLGEMVVSDGENVLTTVPLVAGEEVARMSWGQMFVAFLRMALMAETS